MPLDKAELIDALRAKLKNAPPLNYPILFDLKEDGPIYVDGTVHPADISETATVEPVTTLSMSIENFEKVLNGQLDPNMGALLGKIHISGKLGVALKLSSFLED